jgi:hypothetical protein
VHVTIRLRVGKVLGNGLCLSRGKKLSKCVIAYDWNVDMSSGGLCKSDIMINTGRATCIAWSAKWNFGIKSAFALRQKKIMENLDRDCRSAGPYG